MAIEMHEKYLINSRNMLRIIKNESIKMTVFNFPFLSEELIRNGVYQLKTSKVKVINSRAFK